MIPYCEQHGIAVVGYTPFGGLPARGAGRQVLDEIARANSRTVRQVVLNYLTRRPSVFAIPKASQIPHVEENAGGMGWTLAPEEIAAIDRTFPAPTRVRGLPMR